MSSAAAGIESIVSPHSLVMASAGTGKTFRLTSRFLQHALAELEQGAGGGGDLGAILATTFTRKAAGEILGRVLERLAEAAVEQKKLRELQEHVDPRLTRERCVELLVRIAGELHRLNIHTIDALFQRIASAFELDLGAAPGWKIAEEDEDEQIRSGALNDLLKELPDEEAIALLEMLHDGSPRQSVRRAILGAVTAVYDAFLLSDGREDVWSVYGPDSPPLDSDELGTEVNALRECPLALTAKGEINAHWRKAHDKALAAATAGRWGEFLEGGLAAKIVAGETKFARAEIDAAVVDCYQPLIEHARSVLLMQFRDRNVAAFRLAGRFHEAYERAKLARGKYRFDDVPRLLRSAALDGRLDDLYFRLDGRLRHVLLDEFQDTSLSQFQLLEPILSEILAAADGRSVFCVGDVKQSLYVWRDAEPGLMPAMPGRWPSLVQETLDRSFRSSRVVLDTVNAVFQWLDGNEALTSRPNVTAEWCSGFKLHRAAKDLRGSARLWVAPAPAGEELNKASQFAATMAFAAERVGAILADAPSATVGVLVRTNKHIPRLIYELKQRGIEASEEGGSAIMDAPAVAAAVSAIHLADFPADSAAAYHIATGPLGRVLELAAPVNPERAAEVSARLRERLMAEGYAGVLRWLLRGVAEEMDERGFARFGQLIDLAQKFDESGGRGGGAGGAGGGTRPSEFVRLARRHRAEDPGRRQVRVMSIHKAKGLEFDAVVLPDLESEWRIKPGGVLVDRPHPFAEVQAVTRYPKESDRRLLPALEELHERSTDRVVREELCCLYVAMTRAVHALEMIIHPAEKRAETPSAAAVLWCALADGQALRPGTELWRSEPLQAWTPERRSDGDPGDATAERPEISLALRPGSGSFVPRRARVTPSGLEGAAEGNGVVDVGSVFAIRGQEARGEGTLLHAWFELVEWLEDGMPGERELAEVAERLAIRMDPAAMAEAMGVFYAALRGPAGDVLRRGRYAERAQECVLQVRREHPFVVCLEDGNGREVEMSGQIDRLVLGRSGNEGRVAWADIVDFKTDRVSRRDAPEEFAARVEHYRPQVEAYRRAVGAMYRLPAEAVGASLLFVRAGEVVQI